MEPIIINPKASLKPGEFYQRVVYDMRTGKELQHMRNIFRYRGKVSHLMPNVRLKAVPTNDQLNATTTPIAPGQPEGIAWTWFDQVTYTSGTTTQLDFFQTVQTDGTLGNMQAAGQLPNPMYFQIYHIGVYIRIPPQLVPTADVTAAVNPLTGAINDVHALINGTLQLSIADKIYYQSKIGMNPAGYGVLASQSHSSSITAGTAGSTVSYATNGIPDLRNRNCFWGTLIIPPTQRFLVRMNWTAAITLVAGNQGIVTAMDGYLFRRVL
jgi:hypothetical protein